MCGIIGHFVIVPSVDTHHRPIGGFLESFSPLEDGRLVLPSKDDVARALVSPLHSFS